MDVGPFALEVRVGPHFHVDYQVAVGSALACVALFRHPQVHTVVDALWNIDGFFRCTMSGATTSARDARIPDYLSHAVAVATYLLNHERALPDGLESLTSAAATSRG